MNRRQMQYKIHQAYSHLAVPDVLHSVVSDCQEQKGQVVNMPSQSKTLQWVKRAACAAAVFLLLAGGTLLGIQYHNVSQSVASTISLDVNPSIEIKVNQKEKVLEVTAKNEDARTIIGDMNFHGSNLDVTVNALIGSMLQKGYLSEMANSILVSVDSNDPAQSEVLQRELTQKIGEFFQTGSFSGSVLSQTIAVNAELEQLAGQYGITLGKAQLIQQILAQDSRHTFESLAPLTINELNLLRSSAGQPQSNAIESVGNASEKAYIGQARAKSIALAHAGVVESAASRFSTEFDYEDGVMVYEVEFYAGGYEYNCDINALSGDIVSYEKEHDGNEPANGPSSNAPGGSGSAVSPSGQYISEAKAKSIAFNHAGVKEADASSLKVRFDLDDGRAEYEVEFFCSDTEFDYEIDALTGSIISFDHDAELVHVTSSIPSGNNSASQYIGEAKAKSIAFSHAGISASQAQKVECELDLDDGHARYEVEFHSAGYEYSYEIDALTGAVNKQEREQDD